MAGFLQSIAMKGGAAAMGAAKGIGGAAMGAAKEVGGGLMQGGQQTMGGISQMGKGVGNLFTGNSPAGMQANPQAASLSMNPNSPAGELGFQFDFNDPDTAWHQIAAGMDQSYEGIRGMQDALPQGQQQQPMQMMPPQQMQRRAPTGPMAPNQGLMGLMQLANSFQRR